MENQSHPRQKASSRKRTGNPKRAYETAQPHETANQFEQTKPKSSRKSITGSTDAKPGRSKPKFTYRRISRAKNDPEIKIDPSGKVRLNRLIARFGLCSRRKADEWIEAGRVAIDGVCCRQVGTSINLEDHVITIDGNILDKPPALMYLAFHKPKGVLTTKDDPQGRVTVINMMNADHRNAGVFPVGRLDRDSEGLLFLTNDGDWSKLIASPRQHVWKRYYVESDAPLTQEGKIQLEKGMFLDGRKTFPARVHSKHIKGKMSKKFTIEIREGRNRQIRRMCKKVGLQVKVLRRVAIGDVKLGQLQPGKTRRLTDQEVKALIKPTEHKPAARKKTETKS